MNRSNHGQFTPISAMVMFSTVVFLVGVLNVYKVSRAKLQTQNLADAAALNIASQQASALNKIADLNEWLNHIEDLGVPHNPGEVPFCPQSTDSPDGNAVLPPISCIENGPGKQWIFSSRQDAAAYAQLVYRINQSQQLFVNTYNNFIGAGNATTSNSAANGSLMAILGQDIPDLVNDPTIHVFFWNSASGQSAAKTSAEALLDGHSQPNTRSQATVNTSGMSPLKFTTHPIMITYYKDLLKARIVGTPPIRRTNPTTALLGSLLGQPQPQGVGWMELPQQNAGVQFNGQMPTLQMGGGKSRIGVGVRIIRDLKIPFLPTIHVKATSVAYVVDESGKMGEKIPAPDGGLRPVFKPTYWVKLASSPL